MKKLLILLVVMVLLPIGVKAGGTIHLAVGDNFGATMSIPDTTTNAVYVAADSVNVTVIYQDGTPAATLDSVWYNSGDAEASVINGQLYYFDAWTDMNGAGDGLGFYTVYLRWLNGTGSTFDLRETYTIQQTTMGLKDQSSSYIGSRGLGIYLDSTSGNTNTVIGVDGTASNPVSTLVAARTLSDALGIKRYYFLNASTFLGATVDLAADHQNWEFIGIGHGSGLAFGAQRVDNSRFEHLGLSGAMHASGGDVFYEFCTFGYISANFNGHADNCWLTDTIVVKAGKDIEFTHCHSGVAGNETPTIDFSGGSSGMSMRHYSGGIRVLNGSSNDTISVETDGQLIIDASNTSLTVTARGMMTITDNGTTTSLTKDAVFSRAETTGPIASRQASFDTLAYLGGIWVDDGANTNTVVGTDGTPSNPVGTIATAKTLADAIGVKRIYFVEGTDETIAATMEHYEFIGVGSMNDVTISLGGQDVDGSKFENVYIDGIQGGTNFMCADRCAIDGADSLEIHATNCAIIGPISLRGGNSYLDNCYSTVAGNGTPDMNFDGDAAAINMSMRHYSGGLQVLGMTSDHTMSYETDGQLVINADCVSGNITARGMMTITDNGTTMSITRDAVFSRQESGQWIWSDTADTPGERERLLIIAGDSANWADIADVWRNVDTAHVDTSLIGEWLATGTGGGGGLDSAEVYQASMEALQDVGYASSDSTLSLTRFSVVGANGANFSFYVENSSGTATRFYSSGGAGHGFLLSGNGAGYGLYGSGGATGHGIYGLGGATSGHGIYGLGQLVGHGIAGISGTTSGYGLYTAERGSDNYSILGSIEGTVTPTDTTAAGKEIAFMPDDWVAADSVAYQGGRGVLIQPPSTVRSNS